MPEDKPPSLRLFVAVFPPPTLAAALADEVKKLKLAPRFVRWTLPEQIHLTLNFLGQIPAARVPECSSAIAGACSHSRPHTLEAAGLGAFPSAASPRVLWTGLRGDLEPLLQLKNNLDARLQSVGYIPETREFCPHLTLGRVTHLKPADRVKLQRFLEHSAARSFGSCPVERVALMRSLLSPSGATYVELEGFRLR